MDPKQIAFIICVNDMEYYKECIYYIQSLEVPDGYSIDVICIQEADSMAQGYNAGMRASNARYKVYLHQDTFIVNDRFIYDILEIFQADDQIGMIGVLGVSKLPDNANCYLSWDIGGTYVYDGIGLINTGEHQKEKPGILVEAIDGLIMVTQVDLPWREDFLDGWDFYDVSQSLEMREHGYQIMIPYQGDGWCHHDCGVSKIQKYHYYRHKVIERYPGYFKEEASDSIFESSERERMEKIVEIRSTMMDLITTGRYEICSELADNIREFRLEDTQIREIVNLMEIYSFERLRNDGRSCKWWTFKNWEQIYSCYKGLRSALLRLRFKKDGSEIKKILEQGEVSMTAVQAVASKCGAPCSVLWKVDKGASIEGSASV